jgi:hypothetical protein
VTRRVPGALVAPVRAAPAGPVRARREIPAAPVLVVLAAAARSKN